MTPAPMPEESLAYWMYYFAARIDALFTDDTVPARRQREWLQECVEDLRACAIQDGALSAVEQVQAQTLAMAQHAFIFHDGPDPEALPS